jgi:hypothetical protein
VYASFLPKVDINREYARRQLAKWKEGAVPSGKDSGQWKEEKGKSSVVAVAKESKKSKKKKNDSTEFTETIDGSGSEKTVEEEAEKEKEEKEELYEWSSIGRKLMTLDEW